MSSTTEQPADLEFRRFRDGDTHWKRWQDKIFDADHSHKCPTYIQATPPCQGSCPAGEDIRGYLNIVRGIEKPPAAPAGQGHGWQEYAFRRLTEANPLPSVMGRVCPAPASRAATATRSKTSSASIRSSISSANTPSPTISPSTKPAQPAARRLR